MPNPYMYVPPYFPHYQPPTPTYGTIPQPPMSIPKPQYPSNHRTAEDLNSTTARRTDASTSATQEHPPTVKFISAQDLSSRDEPKRPSYDSKHQN